MNKNLCIGLSVGGVLLLIAFVAVVWNLVQRKPLTTQIVGKWRNPKNQNEVIEFTKRGDVVTWNMQLRLSRDTGKYHIEGDKLMMTVRIVGIGFRAVDAAKVVMNTNEWGSITFRIKIKGDQMQMRRILSNGKIGNNKEVDSIELVRYGS